MNAVSGGKTKKSVLGVLLVAENTPKQLSIRCLLHKHGLVKLLDDVAHLAGCHVLASFAGSFLPFYYPLERS